MLEKETQGLFSYITPWPCLCQMLKKRNVENEGGGVFAIIQTHCLVQLMDFDTGIVSQLAEFFLARWNCFWGWNLAWLAGISTWLAGV